MAACRRRGRRRRWIGVADARGFDAAPAATRLRATARSIRKPSSNEFGVDLRLHVRVVEPANGRCGHQPGAAAPQAEAGVGTFGTRALNSFEDFSLYDRCITRGVGGISPVLYGNGLLIAQTPNEVVISYEMIHDTRIIPLNSNKPRLDSKIKLWVGDSRGWFEGETLVVETTNFTDRTSIAGLHSDKLKLTERIGQMRIEPGGDKDHIRLHLCGNVADRRVEIFFLQACRRVRPDRNVQRRAKPAAVARFAACTGSRIPRILMH